MSEQTRIVLAYLIAVAVWARSKGGVLRAVLADRVPDPQPGRARSLATDTRGSSKTVVATGASVAASGGLLALIKNYWLGGAIYTLSLETSDFIQAIGQFGQVFVAFGSSIAGLVDAGIPREIIDAGTWASATAIRTEFGVSGFIIAIIVSMTGIGLFLWFLANIDWTPTKIFFGGRE